MDTVPRFRIGFTLLLASSFVFGAFNSSKAQETIPTQEEKLDFTIQLRPRAEFRNGLFTPILENQTAAGFVAQRSRLGLKYAKGTKVSVGLQLQMVNTWGNEPQVQATGNSVSLFQAWVQFQLMPHLDLKLGRQVLSYDDERILGELDWNNAGRKHDAALLRYNKGKFRTDFAVAYNQNFERVTNDFYNDAVSQPYKSMEMLWLHYQATKALSLSALVMNIAKQSSVDSEMSHLQTYGFNAFFKQKKFDFNLSSYCQTGQTNFKAIASQKTTAWMASLYGNYYFNKKFSMGLGSDYLSGQDMGSTSTNNTVFNPLYGTHHKFYGAMDYFYVSSPHKNVGLWDSYISASYKATSSFSTNLTFHHFQAPNKILDYSGNTADATLGEELDLSLQYQLKSGIKVTGGYSQMFASESMKYVKSILPTQTMNSIQNWAWLSINFNPDILIFKRSN
ncbi:MAG: alginate export family protein [Chitinophagaceae bacterium]